MLWKYSYHIILSVFALILLLVIFNYFRLNAKEKELREEYYETLKTENGYKDLIWTLLNEKELDRETFEKLFYSFKDKEIDKLFENRNISEVSYKSKFHRLDSLRNVVRDIRNKRYSIKDEREKLIRGTFRRSYIENAEKLTN